MNGEEKEDEILSNARTKEKKNVLNSNKSINVDNSRGKKEDIISELTNWLMNWIKPIHKHGDKNVVSNYGL